jgi:hypothetical protein
MGLKKIVLVIFALLSLCGAVFSQNTGDFTYIQNRGGGVTITGYRGGERDVEIPPDIGGAPVTGIGNRAFYNRGITSVKMPSCVETIGVQAFANNSIITLVLPDGIRIIGISAFSSNNMESVSIPDSVTVISYNAFGGNSLGDIRISRNVRSINPRVFIKSNNPNRIIIGADVDIYQGNFDRSFVNVYGSRNRQEGSYERTGGVWIFSN